MKTLVAFLFVIAATTALASTDFERFDKAVSKFAVQLSGQDKPKGLCLCRNAELERSVGFLLRGSSAPIGTTPYVTSTLSCFVPGFDDTSGAQGVTFICEDFVPITQ
ncbi:MAG TPA: hypothetical protein VN923_01060 [Thermoanaerobaculia bacterium]|nr:hypothetical protein [Thermoanaerobaculia bacterium]